MSQYSFRLSAMGTAANARGHDASKTFNDLFVFLPILIELASDRHPQSHEKLPSELASWTAVSPKNLNATSKSVGVRNPMCLNQDSKFVFLFLEEHRSSMFGFLRPFLVQFQPVRLLSW